MNGRVVIGIAAALVSANAVLALVRWQMHKPAPEPTGTKGVGGWLPRADFIAFVDPDLPDAPYLGSARFEDVLRAMRMPTLGLYPERYDCSGFPSAARLARWGDAMKVGTERRRE